MANGRCEARDTQEKESVISQPANIASKLFAKLRKKSNTNKNEGNYSSFMENGVPQRSDDDSYRPRGPKETVSRNFTPDVRDSFFPGLHEDDENMEADFEKHKARVIEDVSDRQAVVKNRPSSAESQASSSSSESNSISDSDIRWEDLHLAEEVGQGSLSRTMEQIGCCYKGLFWERLR